jgi:hypothetical protein
VRRLWSGLLGLREEGLWSGSVGLSEEAVVWTPGSEGGGLGSELLCLRRRGCGLDS